MTFISIRSLFLIWAVPVLFLFFFYGMRKRKKILARFAAPRGLQSICPDADSARRWLKNVLLLACLLFTAVAIAGPRYGFEWEEIEQKGVDIVVAVDCSKSMLATDIKPSRLARAKREILDLVSILKGDRIGLVAFAGTAFLQCPLTLDYDGFHIFLDILSPDFLPVGGTDLNGAVETAIAGFDENKKTEKAIILITDGESTRGDPAEAAEKAAKAGVRLFCIGVGSPGGVPVPDEKGGFRKDRNGAIVLTKLDENKLKEIALATGGAYVRSVSGDMDLDLVYEREIRGKMEAATLSAGKKKIWQNRFQWALLIALAAFSLELLIASVDSKKSALAAVAFLVFALSFSSDSARAGMIEGVHEKMRQGTEAYEKGDFDKARERFIEAQLEEPERAEISYNLGAAYYESGNYDAAAKNFADALKTESPALKAKSYYNLGNAYFRKRDYKKAIENYDLALGIDPDDKDILENKALAKKLLEEQKQRQQGSESGKDGEEQDKEKQEQKEEQPSGEQNQERKSGAESEKQSPENQSSRNKSDDSSTEKKQGKDSSESDENNSAGEKNESEPGQEEEQASARPEETQARTDRKEQARKEAMDRRQAETMLNRLEDKPGKALIPAYGETRVLKDW